jgi:LuxR family transcriptional regulator, maltose regulon positive regulatory protein
MTEFGESPEQSTKSPLSILESSDSIEKNALAATPRSKSMLMVEPLKDSTVDRMGLIVEKITIPAPQIGLCRPRLLSLLRQSLSSCTATILSGRAGTGKTTLALHFAEMCGRNVAWYKAEAPESELRIFLQYLFASISARRDGFGNGSLETLFDTAQSESATDEELGLLAEAFVHQLERNPGPPLMIVIEDLHLLHDAPWLVPFFRRLLPLLPSDVHMLITSRTMPPAPLWRMRSKQTLTVIGEETLSFTRREAVELFETYNLTPAQAIVAFDDSRGRAAALSTSAATLRYAEVSKPSSNPTFRNDRYPNDN